MAIAKELTHNSWILETDTGDKLGLMSKNDETSTYLLIAEDLSVTFSSFEELGTMIGSPVKEIQRQNLDHTHGEIMGFPICHALAHDPVEVDGVVHYKSSAKGKKLFYAGYWVAQSPSKDSYILRVSISEEVYKDNISAGFTPKGPYIDKIEAQFVAKQLSSGATQP